jgi:hypothetical protein
MTDLIPYSIDQLTYQMQITNKILTLLVIIVSILTITLIINFIANIFQKKKNKNLNKSE